MNYGIIIVNLTPKEIKLLLENNLKEYVFFTNNVVESFNHCINQCLNYNKKVSYTKFEEIIKYVFIKIDGTKYNTDISGYIEKTLIYFERIR